MMKTIHFAEVATLLAIMVVVWLLWDTVLILPLKILVVFFHELSHGLMAVVTGGEIVRIEVVQQEGGLCVTRGGNRFLTLSAGYVGSLVWGGLLLVLAARSRLDRAVSASIGVLLIVATLLWVRPLISFGFIFGLAAGGTLLAVGYLLSHTANDFLLKVIGLTSCLYALLDIKSDIFDRPHLNSDAAMMAAEYGLPTIFWGLLWAAIAMACAMFFLSIACRREAEFRQYRAPSTPADQG
jgi:hypothetical protein